MEYANVGLIKLVLKLSDLISKAGEKMQAWEDETILNFLRTHFLYGSRQETKAVLAAMLHFSPNYVRQVFKAQAGENGITSITVLEGEEGNCGEP